MNHSLVLPEFYDNSKDELIIERHPTFQHIPQKSTNVSYTASDDSGNNNTCVIQVVIEGMISAYHYHVIWEYY